MKLLLCVDLDGTIADLVGELLTVAHQRLGRTYRRRDWRCYGVEESFPHDVEMIELCHQLMEDPQTYRRLAPLRGSSRALRRLSRTYALQYLSARPAQSYEVTIDWLAAHGFPPAPLLLMPGWQTKRQLITDQQRIGPVLVIDDSPLLVSELFAPRQRVSEAGQRLWVGMVLIDQPYNRAVMPAQHLLLRRARRWCEVDALLTQLWATLYLDDAPLPLGADDRSDQSDQPDQPDHTAAVVHTTVAQKE